MACATVGLGARVTAGFAPNFFDIAPRHAGVISGISTSIPTLQAIAAVFITGCPWPDRQLCEAILPHCRHLCGRFSRVPGSRIGRAPRRLSDWV